MINYKVPRKLLDQWRLDGGVRLGDPRRKPKLLNGSWLLSRNVFLGYMPPWNVLSFCHPSMPLLSLRVWGLWQNRYIFQISNGSQQCRVASVYDLSTKAWMPPYWPAFRSAVAAWQGLSAGTKRRLNARASKLGLRYSGYNYFISMFLKSSPHLANYYPE